MSDRSAAAERRPRVLLLLHQASRTGAPILTRDIFQTLSDDVVLRSIAWDGGPLEDDFRRMGSLTVLSTYPRFLPRLHVAREATAAAKAFGRARLPIEGYWARRWRPDVVYANSVWSLPLVARLGLAGRPTLLHVHELSVALAEFQATHPGLLEAIPSRYIAVSDAVAAALQHEYHVPAASITLIRPFVPMSDGTERPARSPGSPLVVGGMGNPSWIKGGVLWLLAAREVVDRLGEGSVRFRWVGIRENAEGRQFRAMADKLGLAASVDFIPETRTPLADVATFDVLAVTSWEESASLVVLEAMGLSVPIVAFRGVGGAEEVLTDGGILVDGFSPTTIGMAIVGLLRDPERRRSIGLAGRAQAEAFNHVETGPLVLQEILGLMSGRA